MLRLLLLLVEQALEGFFDQLDQSTKTAEDVSEAEAPALDADGVNEEVDLEGVLADCLQD